MSGQGQAGASTAGKGGQGQAVTPQVQPGAPMWNQPAGTQYSGNVFGNSANALQAGQEATHSMLNYQPMMVGGAGVKKIGTDWGYDAVSSDGMTGPGGYASQALANTDLGQYMNPYTDQVINQTMSDLDRARLMAVNDTGADATRAGAFGGARHALRESQNDAEFYDQVGRTTGQLRNQGYMNAQNMALTDIGNQNQASQFNLGQDLQTRMANLQNSQFNAASENQARQFGQSSGLQAALGNQNASVQGASNALRAALGNQQAHLNGGNLRLNAASQMGQMSNLGFGMGQQVQAGNSQQGANERALQQQLIGAAQGQFGGFTQAPGQSVDRLNSIFTNGGGAGTSQYNPGATDYLSTLIAAYGAYAASDIRLKDNVKYIGRRNGHNTYSWSWTQGAIESGLPLGPETGVLAQEVAQTHPEAVIEHDSGYLMVNYGAL